MKNTTNAEQNASPFFCPTQPNTSNQNKKREHGMTIFRLPHEKRYSSISNELAQNNKLSLRARGLMLYFLSLPNDWVVRIAHLEAVLLEGRTAIMTTVRELRDAGYIHSTKRDFQGSFEYFVFESPTSEDEFKKSLQSSRFPIRLESSLIGDRPLQSTNRTTTKNLSKNKHPTLTQPKNENQKTSYRENVPLTEEEFLRLTKIYGEEKLSKMLDRLEVYCGSTGKRYKSAYHALLPAGWVNRSMEEDKRKESCGYQKKPGSSLTTLAANEKRLGSDGWDPEHRPTLAQRKAEAAPRIAAAIEEYEKEKKALELAPAKRATERSALDEFLG
jgi:hypothetical protein